MNTASFYLIIQNWWDPNKKKWSGFLTGEESVKKHRGEQYNGIVGVLGYAGVQGIYRELSECKDQ